MKKLFSLLVVSLMFLALGFAENGPPITFRHNSSLNEMSRKMRIEAKTVQFVQKEVVTTLPYFDFANDVIYPDKGYTVNGKIEKGNLLTKTYNQKRTKEKMVKNEVQEVIAIWPNDQENNFKKVTGIFFLTWIQHEMTEEN